MSPNDKEALERLEEEKERRILERVAAGQAVFIPPLVVGVESDEPVAEGQRDASGRELYYGTPKKDGAVDRTACIITGVPRSGRDSEEAVERLIEHAKQNAHRSDPLLAKALQAREAPQVPPEPPEPEPQRRPIRATIELPTDNSLGAVVEGSYVVRDNMVYVFDDRGQPIGRHDVSPGEDPENIARRLLRLKRGVNAFYRRIQYPPTSIH
jgi:hypothetical protein